MKTRGELTPLRPTNYQAKWISDHADHVGDGCLKWPFKRNKRGIAVTNVNRIPMNAARAMCIEAHGPPPSPDHDAAHNCGKGHEGCIHPGHLRWATKVENQADRLLHGTDGRGERHPGAKLTDVDVIAIRVLEISKSRNAIADQFGISKYTVFDIVTRRSWRHI